MKRIRLRKKTLLIPLVLISGAAIIGSSIAAGIIFNSKADHAIVDNNFLVLDSSSLNIIDPNNLKPSDKEIKNATIPGLEISYDANHPILNDLKNQINQETVEKDVLFFIQNLMLSKSKDLEMQIKAPKVILTSNREGNLNVNITFQIIYQNKTKFTQYYHLDSNKRPFSIRNSYEIFDYSIVGEIEPRLYENNLYGYEIIGNNTVTSSKGSSIAIQFNEPSKAINTQVLGLTKNLGYFDIENEVNEKLKILTVEQMQTEIFDKQKNDFEMVKKLSINAQNILRNIAENQTVEEFLYNSADDLVVLIELALNGAEIPFKETIFAILPDILENKSLPKIMHENSEAIIEILQSIVIFAPFLPTLEDILRDSEENIKNFIARDLVAVLGTIGAGIAEQFPGLPDLLTLLGSDDGILTVLTAKQTIPLLVSVLNLLVPNFSELSVVEGLLNILMQPDDQILNKPIIDFFVTLIASQKVGIQSKGNAILVDDPNEISQLKASILNKDMNALDMFFSNVKVQGPINSEDNPPTTILNPDFNKISVAITQENENGFSIELSIVDSENNLYFPNGEKVIRSVINYGEIEKLPSDSSIISTSGNFLYELLKNLIPNIDSLTMNLLPAILFDNPNMTSPKLQKALNALANPEVAGTVGTYYDWLNSIEQEENSSLLYDSETLHLSGFTSIKYTFRKSLSINLKDIYPILPPNLNLGDSSIPIQTIISLGALPDKIWAVDGDYVEFGQKFNSKISFDVIGENVFWQAPSKTVIDVNMPGTFLKVWDEFGYTLWTQVGPLYEELLPNIFYSIKEMNGIYTSQKSVDNLKIKNYDPNIYNGTSVVEKMNSTEINELKNTLKNNVQEIIVPDSQSFELEKKLAFFKWKFTLEKKQNILNYDLEKEIVNIFNVDIGSSGIELPIFISYENIKILDPITLSLIGLVSIPIPELSFQTIKIYTPFNVYNGKQDGVMMQRVWTF